MERYGNYMARYGSYMARYGNYVVIYDNYMVIFVNYLCCYFSEQNQSQKPDRFYIGLTNVFQTDLEPIWASGSSYDNWKSELEHSFICLSLT